MPDNVHVPLGVKVTVPVGVIAVPTEVSVTVAVHVVAWLTATGEVHETPVVVLRGLTVTVVEPELPL